MTVPPGPPPGYGPVPPQPVPPPPWPPQPVPPPQPAYPPYPGPHGHPGYPGYQGHLQPPPPGRPGSARTKLLVTAAALLTASGMAGAGAAWSFTRALGAEPPESAQFRSGTSTAVDFTAGETKLIYSKSDDKSHPVYCTVASAGTREGLSMNSVDDVIMINDWRATITVTAQQAGRYTVSCTGYPNDLFGVGAPTSAGRIGAPLLLGLLAGALGLAAVVTGLVGLTKPRSRP